MISSTGYVRPVTLLCFWVLPLVVPVAFVIRLLMDSPGMDTPVGWACLALPAGLVSVERPLRGWESLQRSLASASPVRPVEAAKDPELPTHRPITVELHGHVGHGESAVYCFLDTESKKWFRLSPGESDTDRKLVLQPGDNDDLYLLNLSSGCRYRIFPGRRSPELVGEEH